MLLLIIYDVSTANSEGRRRLSKVAKICCNHGQRVQNSCFECDLAPDQLVTVRARLLEVIDKSQDSLRIYNLGNNYNTRIEHYGIKESYDPEGELIL